MKVFGLKRISEPTEPVPKEPQIEEWEFVLRETEENLRKDAERLGSPEWLRWQKYCEDAGRGKAEYKPNKMVIRTARQELFLLNLARKAKLREPLNYLPTTKFSCPLTRR